MLVGEFLNRTDALRQVQEFLADEGGARLLCITGPPGCGKSSLVRHAVGLARGWRLVTVDRAGTVEGAPAMGTLASALADRIGMQAPEDDFPPRRTTLDTLRDASARSVAASAAVVGKAFKTVAVTTEAVRQFRTLFPAFQGEDPDAVYVRDALGRHRCVVDIDHAVECSPQDWLFLAVLLQTSGCMAVVEGDRGFVMPSSFPPSLVTYLRLPPLEMSYASILFGSLSPAHRTVLEGDFVRTGDLRGYEALAARRERLPDFPTPLPSLSDTLLALARAAVGRLSEADRQLLVVLTAHAGGPAGIGLLRRFISTRSAPAGTSDLLARLRRLEGDALVIVTTDGVHVPFLTFGIVADDRRLNAARLVALRDWRDFYRDPDACGLPVADTNRCLHALRQCALLKDGVGIAVTLEQLGVQHADAGSRADSASTVAWLASQFDLREQPSVAVAVARHLYSAGWFERARDILLAAGELHGRRDRFLLAELYCAAGPQHRGIGLALDYLSRSREHIDPDSELCLELVVIHGLRNSDKFDEARTRYRTALLQQRYKDRPAYPVLLRFADLCLMRDEDLDECCSLLEHAASGSLERHLSHEAVSAWVALSQQHGYHDLDRAEEFLGRAAEASANTWIQLPAILNNHAVLTMYRGRADPHGLALLEDALILAADPLDELFIRSNILVHRMLSGTALGSTPHDLAALVGSGLDTETRRVVHYNLWVAFGALGDGVLAAHHEEGWRRLDSGIDRAYWKARMTGRAVVGVPEFRLTMAGHPVLLSHWKLGTVPFDAVPDDVGDETGVT